MTTRHHVAILSDIHYASAAEQARGEDYEFRDLKNPLIRSLIRFHRHFIWLRYPFRLNRLVDRFIERAGTPDFVVANGDYSCNSAFVRVCGDAAFQSASECLCKNFAIGSCQTSARLSAITELGKLSTFGGRGGMQLKSWHRGP